MKISPKIYKKYTQAGPNYLYYPTTLEFQGNIKHEVIADKLIEIEGNQLNLQLLFPLCKDPDCHSTRYQIQLEDDSQLNRYIESIKSEIQIYKKYIKKVTIVEIHLSGNETLQLEPARLSQLLNFIAESFSINLKEIDLSLDFSARLLGINKLEVLKNIGFNRLNISTLNFDYNLQISPDHYQSYQHVENLLQVAKKMDFDAVNVELFYGLPDESYEGMKNTINDLITLNCEQISLSHYFHRPYIFKLQKLLSRKHLATNDENYQTFKMCIDKLLSNGYKHLGMNCFVNSNNDLYAAQENRTLSYNHNGYTLNTVNDVISFGTSSISKVGDLFYQNMIKIDDYYRSIASGVIPAYRSCSLSSDHLFRKNIIKSLIIRSRFDIDDTNKNQFNLLDYINETCSHLYEMEADELVILSNSSIEVTEVGKHFLKNICALFDLNMRELISFDVND